MKKILILCLMVIGFTATAQKKSAYHSEVYDANLEASFVGTKARAGYKLGYSLSLTARNRWAIEYLSVNNPEPGIQDRERFQAVVGTYWINPTSKLKIGPSVMYGMHDQTYVGFIPHMRVKIEWGKFLSTTLGGTYYEGQPAMMVAMGVSLFKK